MPDRLRRPTPANLTDPMRRVESRVETMTSMLWNEGAMRLSLRTSRLDARRNQRVPSVATYHLPRVHSSSSCLPTYIWAFCFEPHPATESTRDRQSVRRYSATHRIGQREVTMTSTISTDGATASCYEHPQGSASRNSIDADVHPCGQMMRITVARHHSHGSLPLSPWGRKCWT